MTKKFIKLFFFLITLFSFIYIFRTVNNMSIDWSSLFNVKMLILAIISIFILTLNLFLVSIVYRKNMGLLSGKEFPPMIINSIYLKANIAKYLPGNVFHFAGRNLLGLKRNIDQKILLASTILLHIQTISMAIVIPVIFDFNLYKNIFSFISHIVDKKYLISVIGVLILVLMVVIFFYKTIKEFIQYIQINISNISIIEIITNFALIGVYLLIYGLSFYIINYSILEIDLNNYSFTFKIISSFIIAWLCGLIVIGAPGGIGIREAVLLFLLQADINKSELLLIIILHRLCTIIADIISFLLGNLIEKIWERKNEKKNKNRDINICQEQ